MKLKRMYSLRIMLLIALYIRRTVSMGEESSSNVFQEEVNGTKISFIAPATEGLSEAVAIDPISRTIQTENEPKSISKSSSGHHETNKQFQNDENQDEFVIQPDVVYTRFENNIKEKNNTCTCGSAHKEARSNTIDVKEIVSVNKSSVKDHHKKRSKRSAIQSGNSRHKMFPYSMSNESYCPAEIVDCNLFQYDQYKIFELSPPDSSNISELVEYAEKNVCKPTVKPRVAIESRKELAELITCYLCDDLSAFSGQVKKHILTGGIVDTSQISGKMSASRALENYGNWENWPTKPNPEVPEEVLLLNSETGLEESADILISSDIYAVVLLGSLGNGTHCNTTECLYWNWGLISYSAPLHPEKRIRFVLCEDPPSSPITESSSSVITASTTIESTSTIKASTSTTIASTSTTIASTSTTIASTSTTIASTSTTTASKSTSIPSTTSTTSITTPTSTALSTTSKPSTSTIKLTTPDVDVCCNINMDLYRYWLCPGEETTMPCPNENNVGYQIITCNSGNQLVVLEDNCLMQWIDDVRNMIALGNSSAVDISHIVRNHTNHGGALSRHDLETLVGVLDNLTILVDSQVQLLPNISEREFFLVDYNNNFVHIVGDILSVPTTWDGLRKKEAGHFGGALLFNLETSGFLLAGQLNDSIHFFHSLEVNMTVSATPRAAASGKEMFIPNSQHPTYIHLPKNFETLLPDGESHVKLVVFLLQQQAARRALPASLNRGVPNGSYKDINSAVLSATVGKEGHHLNFSQLNDYVIMRLQHAFKEAGPLFRDLYRDQRPGEVATPVPGTASCVYWDNANTSWSPEGCKVINTTREVTYCVCQHLTMISIITDIHDYVGRDQVLDIMGTVLSSMSCLSLAIAFCIFHFYKSIASPRVTITKQLCVALGISQLLLLFLLDKDFLKLSETACSISAMVLHYWMTSAVFWMLAEGLHLLQTVSDVLSHISYMPAYWLLGYGVPLILVVITLLVAYGLGQWSLQGAYAPPNSEYCWLTTEDGYIWAFTGPLIVIITINTLTMILALRSAARLRTNQRKTLPEQVKLWVKGCFSLNCILGTTWVFGFLYINTAHVFAYIFTIFNASQGIMILLLHCIINDTVRTAILKSLPPSVAKRLKHQTDAAKRQTVAVISRGSTSPRASPAQTTLNSLSTTPSSSPGSTPPTEPTQRMKGASMERDFAKSNSMKRSASSHWKDARGLFPSSGLTPYHRESIPYNVTPTTAEGFTPRVHRPLRNGSQLSNSTQSTFMSDHCNSYNCSRRTSFESYDSTNSSSSEDSYPSYTEMALKLSEDYYGHTDISRYIPGFAAIQECDEKSVRSSFSY